MLSCCFSNTQNSLSQKNCQKRLEKLAKRMPNLQQKAEKKDAK
jgi:hypothetical protein